MRLLRPCRKLEEWYSELETTCISLIGWPLSTSITYYRLFGNEREFLAIVLKGRNSLSFPNSLYFILGFSLQCDNILSYDKFTNSTVDLVWFINPFRFVFYPLAMYSCAIFLAMNGKFLIFHFFVLVGSQWNWCQSHHWAQYCHTGIQANFEIIIE